MSTLTANRVSIPYPSEVRFALERDPEQFQYDARELLAIKLYEIGRLSSGLAAQLAGVSRSQFLHLLGRYDISPFEVSEDELTQDIANAISASHR